MSNVRIGPYVIFFLSPTIRIFRLGFAPAKIFHAILPAFLGGAELRTINPSLFLISSVLAVEHINSLLHSRAQYNIAVCCILHQISSKNRKNG
jgi:hypothetical protein